MFRQSRALVALLALLPLLASCDQDHNELQRSAVEFGNVAEHGVFVCGIWDAGSDKEFGTEDDFRPAGHFPITLRNRAYNEFATAPDYTPYGNFHVDNIAVRWEATTSNTPLTELEAFNYSANYDVVIPQNEEITFNVMAVPFEMKSSPYFANLAPAPRGTGATPPFSAVATITVTGHLSGAPDWMIDVEGSAIVEFVGVIVEQ